MLLNIIILITPDIIITRLSVVQQATVLHKTAVSATVVTSHIPGTWLTLHAPPHPMGPLSRGRGS
jgi:hypothetical protein